MNPEDLNDDERDKVSRTILRILQAGGSREQAVGAARSALAAARKTPTAPAKMPPLGEYGQGGNIYPRGTGNLPDGYAYNDLLGNIAGGEGAKAVANVGRMTANRLFELGTAAAVPALGKLGAGIASRIPKNAWGYLGRALIPSAFEAAGQGGGEALREAAVEGKIDPTRVGKSMAWTGGSGAALRGLGMGGALLGGVKGEAVQSAMDDTSLMQRNPRGTWFNFRDEIRADAESVRGMTSQGRGQFEALMRSKDAQGLKVDGFKMLDAVFEEAQKLTGHGSEAAKRMLYGNTGNRIFERISKVSKNGMMKAADFDKILQEEMTRSVYDKTSASGKMFHEAFERARDRAAGYLYTSVSPGRAAAMQARANEHLNALETIEDVVALPRSGLDTRGIRELRNALNTEEGVAMERALETYDRINGTAHLPRLRALTSKSDWNPTDMADFQEIAQLPFIGYRPRAIVSAGIREVAGKGIIKAAQSPLSGFLRSLAVSEMMQPSHEPTGAKKKGSR